MHDRRPADPRGSELRALVAALVPLTALPLAAACGTCPDSTTVVRITDDDFAELSALYGSEALPTTECNRLCGLDDGTTTATGGGGSGGGSTDTSGTGFSGGFQNVLTCELVTIEFSQPAVLCTGTNACGGVGRRPPGLAGPDRAVAGSSPIGRYFAEMARLESASVPAFLQLQRELAAFGAPRDLLLRTRSAARDEARHARVCRALARRFGAQPLRASVRPTPLRTMAQVAADNAREGCVGESFGAITLALAAARAADPGLREALARIASDEAEHAALSFDIDAWLSPRLSERERGAVALARRAALVTLEESSAVPVHHELADVVGVIAPVEASAWLRRVGALCVV